MKTALELLGDDGERILDGILCAKGEERDECAICRKSISAFELIARRAREEMREENATFRERLDFQSKDRGRLRISLTEAVSLLEEADEIINVDHDDSQESRDFRALRWLKRYGAHLCDDHSLYECSKCRAKVAS